MKQLITVVVIALLSTQIVLGQENTAIYLIPQPVYLVQDKGTLNLGKTVSIYIENKNGQNVESAKLFLDYLKVYYGIEGAIINKKKSLGVIILSTNADSTYKPEGYSLKVDGRSIVIAGRPAGVFYGLETLKQLITRSEIGIAVTFCRITDYPTFPWRGMHLDVCRHFFPVSFIKKYIDYLAMYKMNTFHWHLTDDQGWRIEIKKYPRLTEVGSWRNSTLIGHYSDIPHKFDSIRYGGYYTQDEVREVVEYALKRHITIIPEIEMPGHSVAALTAYPELSCTGGPFKVESLWGVFDDVFCTKEETFHFLEDVLTEIIDIFPSKVIHIGGDESPKVRWEKCPICQQRIKDEGLKNEHELQSYFIRRIEKFVNSKGRSIIGWDEILEGGLAPNAAVMSWRGTEGGIAAAKEKHNVVMTPGSHCYFDYYQGNPKSEPLAIGGYIPVDKVYQFDPVPSALNENEKHFILGAQGNLWTEYIDNEKKVEYMVFPRISALSEVVWTYPKERNFEHFRTRLIQHFNWYDRLGINYSKSLFELKMEVIQSESNNSINVLILGAPDTEIRYSTDSSKLSDQSLQYTAPICISTSGTLRVGVFKDGVLYGPELTQEFKINLATGKNIKLTTPPHENYRQGGAMTLVDGILGRIPWFGGEWLGFSGKNCEAIIDLKSIQPIQRVIVDVLNAEYSWIYLPKSTEVFISDDGVSYTSVIKLEEHEIKSMNRQLVLEIGNLPARYVKVIVENLGIIPEGKPGAGSDAWLFVDEISVE